MLRPSSVMGYQLLDTSIHVSSQCLRSCGIVRMQAEALDPQLQYTFVDAGRNAPMRRTASCSSAQFPYPNVDVNTTVVNKGILRTQSSGVSSLQLAFMKLYLIIFTVAAPSNSKTESYQLHSHLNPTTTPR